MNPLGIMSTSALVASFLFNIAFIYVGHGLAKSAQEWRDAHLRLSTDYTTLLEESRKNASFIRDSTKDMVNFERNYDAMKDQVEWLRSLCEGNNDTKS
jgi:hypothetical protein